MTPFELNCIDTALKEAEKAEAVLHQKISEIRRRAHDIMMARKFPQYYFKPEHSVFNIVGYLDKVSLDNANSVARCVIDDSYQGEQSSYSMAVPYDFLYRSGDALDEALQKELDAMVAKIEQKKKDTLAAAEARELALYNQLREKFQKT